MKITDDVIRMGCSPVFHIYGYAEYLRQAQCTDNVKHDLLCRQLQEVDKSRETDESLRK